MNKFINDISFVILGVLLVMGAMTKQYQNVWVMVVCTNALSIFIIVNYRNSLKNWIQKVKEDIRQDVMENVLSADLPPIPPLQKPLDPRLQQLSKKYNINPDVVNYNQDEELDSQSGNEELDQKGIDQIFSEHKNVVNLKDYRENRTPRSAFNRQLNPNEGA